ncbi:hypothetical protein L2E82_04526 [Cichorium intybus]|uniref:Uncharacterized protein n=1 Tax=Cichorium intybus TaxID=13427 RepID=A0ACB9H5K3_CICIN|nr:hypothetical protein L2E82_04526 [Cichorium intybus]
MAVVEEPENYLLDCVFISAALNRTSSAPPNHQRFNIAPTSVTTICCHGLQHQPLLSQKPAIPPPPSSPIKTLKYSTLNQRHIQG